jgi:hypothetical protein
MTTKPTDPLLAVARILLFLLMGVLAVAAAALLVAAPFALIFREPIVHELALDGMHPEGFWAILALILLAALCAAIGFLFFRNLYRIVGTVGEGDPFVPVNAKRLSDMGWIVVAIHVVSIPLVAAARFIEDASDKVHTDANLNLTTGVLMALILFILARVFREGTRMREELEGTV